MHCSRIMRLMCHGGAARRRLTLAYIISQAGLLEAGVDARSDESGDEFSSTSGDTFSDMIMKLLKQMTMGDGIININVYNLLHQAGLDEFLVNSLTSALKLEGEDDLTAVKSPPSSGLVVNWIAN